MTSNARIMTTCEIDDILAKHPNLEIIEVLVPDINGVLRGKLITPDKLPRLCNGQFKMPKTTLAFDIWGNDIEKLVFEHGDPDGYCLPVEDSLLPVPWAKKPTAQILTSMHDDTNTASAEEPQAILANILALFAEQGLTPVVATELEFYLMDKDQVKLGRAPTPLTKRQIQSGISGAQVYSIDMLELFDDVIRDIKDACHTQDLPVDTLIKEASYSQFEVNLMHLPNALRAADQALFLKRAIKGTALKHDMVASFMAKPFSDQAGNGFHVHLSIIDENGNNIFDNGSPEGSDALRFAVNGLIESSADLMAIFAPNINSYRRFQTGSHAPLSATWGYDNRTAAIRIPSGDNASRRLEHRVAGADANPYLVLAGILAGVYEGLVQKKPATKPITGSAYEDTEHALPTNWMRAFNRFETSPFIEKYFGKPFSDYYMAIKEQELASQGLEITGLEYDSYLKLA